MGIFSFLNKPKNIVPDNQLLLSRPLFTVSYDGEKTPGELGVVKNFEMDYVALRARSWQSFLENEVTQIIIKKYLLWVIGNGLKLQSEPIVSILEDEGIKIDSDKFSSQIESKFRLFAKSKFSSYNNVDTVHTLAKKSYKESIIGGDSLVILRVINNQLKVQIIDGENVVTPYLDEHYKVAKDRGNTIENGIELSPTGEHIAYFIQTLEKIERVEARTTNGALVAYMVYGTMYRLDEVRGIPVLSATLETLKKLDRYKEATVGSAEERAKIPYTIIHNEISTGANPLTKGIGNAINAGKGTAVETGVYDNAQHIALTTQKSVFNLERGSELKSLESKTELNFEDFYTANIKTICAALTIPYEVAYSMYDSNYSASRAAIKDWEHIKKDASDYFSQQFYKPIYDLFLEIEILKDKVNANGYLKALTNNDNMVLEAYREARFVGANVPHIDPLKEVAAERAKLGSLSAHIPLTTLEQAVENVNGGEFAHNIKRYMKELDLAKELQPETPEPNVKD